jgi:hypothetical protein
MEKLNQGYRLPPYSPALFHHFRRVARGGFLPGDHFAGNGT